MITHILNNPAFLAMTLIICGVVCAIATSMAFTPVDNSIKPENEILHGKQSSSPFFWFLGLLLALVCAMTNPYTMPWKSGLGSNNDKISPVDHRNFIIIAAISGIITFGAFIRLIVVNNSR